MKDLIKNLLSKLTHSNEFIDVNVDANPAVKFIHKDDLMIDLEEYRTQPRRIKEKNQFSNLKPFITYVNQFQNIANIPNLGTPTVFIDNDETTVECFGWIDYHNGIESATHKTNSIRLSSQKTQDFDAWMRRDNTWIEHSDFCDMLKAHAHSFDLDELTRILSSLEDVNSNTSMTKTLKDNSKGSSKSQFFSVIENFAFTFKPFVSMPYTFQVNARLSANYVERDDEFKFKFVMESPYLIYQKVAEKLHEDLSAQTALVLI